MAQVLVALFVLTSLGMPPPHHQHKLTLICPIQSRYELGSSQQDLSSVVFTEFPEASHMYIAGSKANGTLLYLWTSQDYREPTAMLWLLQQHQH